MSIDWVILDVGEVLIDESRVWATWAGALGVSPLTFGAAMGAAIVKGLEHRGAFDLLGFPDWHDLRDEVERRFGGFQPVDLYADALRALDSLRNQGRRTAIIANQPAIRHEQLERIGVHAEVMAMSEELGVAKPDPKFYARCLDLLGNPHPATVAYVGDRLDNDVRPSRRNGLRAVWLRRGPWGRLQDDTDGDADLVVWSLDELARRLPELDD